MGYRAIDDGDDDNLRVYRRLQKGTTSETCRQTTVEYIHIPHKNPWNNKKGYP
jgi:hypothetical protein